MKKILFVAALAGAAMMSACGDKGGIRMGSLSDFDSLSYALGANVANSLSSELRDIPLDYAALDKAVVESALGKSTQDVGKSTETLQDYFMTKRGPRAQAIAAKRAQADSVRLAGGDSTKADYPVADPDMFESETERTDVSTAFGTDIGNSFKGINIPLQMVWVAEAMKNVRDGQPKMNEDEVNQFLQYYFTVKRPAENAEASKKWLEKKEKQSGVQKTASGLLYKVTKEGDASMKATSTSDEVKVHYTGRTRDGKVFDSSIFENRSKEQQDQMKKQDPEGYNKNEPISFPLNRVIPGWTEGMQLVGKGGKITLWIPAELAYGVRGAGRDIGPNEALEFEVELIDVTPAAAPAAPEVAPEAAPVK